MISETGILSLYLFCKPLLFDKNKQPNHQLNLVVLQSFTVSVINMPNIIEKPITKLFLLMSVDGKISTGFSIDRSFDQDLPKLDGIKEGLQQYYSLQEELQKAIFNSGKVLAKIGANQLNFNLNKTNTDFVVVDNSHLTTQGIKNLSRGCKRLFFVTSNSKHPVHKLILENMILVGYEKEIDFVDLFQKLKTQYQIDELTIQSGGTLNSILLRNNLIDEVSLVVFPALIGGTRTPSIIGGSEIEQDNDLQMIKSMDLVAVEVLQNSYLHLRYKVRK